jgi:rSAM/selenodomain-associated transferase 1
MPVPRSRVVVFLRAPRAGSVKTRLAAALGEDAALDVYRDLLAATFAALADQAGVELRHTPDDAGPEIAPMLRAGWAAAPQGGGGLSERLARAVDDAFRSGAGRVLVIGSDCPYLTGGDIGEALDALEESDLVLGPALDGGYWLIGLRRPAPYLFRGVPWSTPDVLAATRRHAEAAGLHVALLRALADIDTPEDWKRWRGPLPEAAA